MVRVLSPPQSRSKAVVCVSTPRMYPRSGYFLVLKYFKKIFEIKLIFSIVFQVLLIFGTDKIRRDYVNFTNTTPQFQASVFQTMAVHLPLPAPICTRTNTRQKKSPRTLFTLEVFQTKKLNQNKHYNKVLTPLIC